jgi:hypothetical protein
VACGGERTAVEIAGFDVRVLRVRAIARGSRIPPRLHEASCVEEVERQQLGVLVAGVDATAHKLLANAGVQLAPAAERKPFVGGVPDQRVPESVSPAAVRNDDLGEPRPGRPIRCILEQRCKKVVGKAHTEDGRLTEQAPVPWGKAVDLGDSHCLDRVRQPLNASHVPDTAQELLEEQRIAPGALGERGDLMLVERSVLGRGVKKNGGVALR